MALQIQTGESPGAKNRKAISVNATETFVSLGSPSPSLIIGYRVRNVGANPCTVRVLRSLTSEEYDPLRPNEWVELVAGAEVVATGDTGILSEETIATGVAVGVVSADGTDVIVELLVAK